MLNLFGLTYVQLQEFCQSEGLPKFAARQMADWLYAKRTDAIDAMTNLSLKARARIGEVATIQRLTPVDCQVSRDGTKKYLFSVADLDTLTTNHYVEAVYIPDDDRATLCVSCQVGCKMACRFCVTGQQGFHGNLDTSHILSQIVSIPEFEKLTNIVFMGMGEPMDNYENVLRATQVLTSEWGFAWSPRRITVSSVGITPMLRRFLDESQCHLAVSLHNPFPEQRLEIMPMQKAFPMADTLALLKQYDWTGQRRISFEYTMFQGLNDTLVHAAELVRVLQGLPCRVNLIRFHTSPNTPFRTSSDRTIIAFKDYLNKHGVTCTLRASRGQDIMAACGLLAGQARGNQNSKKS